MMLQENATKQWGKLVARAWADEAFKQRLMTEPASVLAEYGVEVPFGVEFKVMEDTPEVRHLILPASPVDELLDEELVGSAGADSFSLFSGGCRGCGGSGGCGCRGCI